VIERRRDPTDGHWTLFCTEDERRLIGQPAAEPYPWSSTEDGRMSEVVVYDRFPPATHSDGRANVNGDLNARAAALAAAEVVVFANMHDTNLTQPGVELMEALVHVWADRYSELGAREDVRYVLIFENRGQAAGGILDQPHGQIYGYSDIPGRVRGQLDRATKHLASAGTCVVCDVVAREQSDGVRVVTQNESFIAHVPFAARFPYEVQVASKRHAASLLDLTDPERRALADVLVQLVRGYDRLFGLPLPYVMAIQQAPTDDDGWEPVSHIRFEFTPAPHPAEELKLLGGSEIGAGEFINDALPEASAAMLRASLAE
jgi:UDPglucose--hexose-1-phosphate uridylyltransferase